jgi:hypothetical protein
MPLYKIYNIQNTQNNIQVPGVTLTRGCAGLPISYKRKVYNIPNALNISNHLIVSMIPGNLNVAGWFFLFDNMAKELLKVASKWVMLNHRDFEAEIK